MEVSNFEQASDLSKPDTFNVEEDDEEDPLINSETVINAGDSTVRILLIF